MIRFILFEKKNLTQIYVFSSLVCGGFGSNVYPYLQRVVISRSARKQTFGSH